MLTLNYIVYEKFNYIFQNKTSVKSGTVFMFTNLKVWLNKNQLGFNLLL